MLLLPAFESTPPPPASRPTQSRANRLVIWMWLARKELRQVDQEADDEEAIISVPMICWSRGGSRPPPTAGCGAGDGDDGAREDGDARRITSSHSCGGTGSQSVYSTSRVSTPNPPWAMPKGAVPPKPSAAAMDAWSVPGAGAVAESTGNRPSRCGRVSTHAFQRSRSSTPSSSAGPAWLAQCS